jgi:hypothetical protein
MLLCDYKYIVMRNNKSIMLCSYKFIMLRSYKSKGRGSWGGPDALSWVAGMFPLRRGLYAVGGSPGDSGAA